MQSRVVAVLFLLALVVVPKPAAAQLISPGKLSAPHAALEGLSNCTTCHELGKRGISDAKCLSCHRGLQDRIARQAGLHASFTGKACASCHKEHFGVQFAMLKFDTAGFDHSKTGYTLKSGHLKATCRDCHQSAYMADTAVVSYAGAHKTLGRTYLGLGRACISCHHKDDVHRGQFAARACSACHTEKTWKDAPAFDHNQTRYILTGKHVDLRCSACHKAAMAPGSVKPVIRFAGLTFSTCTDCHRDPHQGRMKQTCESCHSTADWNALVNRSKFEAAFDHSRTRFSLKGAHAKASCATCHDPRAMPSWTVQLAFLTDAGRNLYPAPRATDCLACHVDVHQSSFARTPGGTACQSCHTESGWIPVVYDLARHNKETYQLTGAHLAVPCNACHPPATPTARVPVFRLQAKECVSCHAKSDPHQGQFAGRACSECHVTEAFRVIHYDHSKTRYPLDGAHQKVPCGSCHQKTTTPQGTFVRYKPLETTCRACHGAAIPRRT